MFHQQPSGIPELLNEPLAVASIPHTSLMDLPNELLTAIVKLIGPPDASCCDPGWFVVPAVCRRLREVAEKVAACWESGEVVGPGGDVREKYEWRTFTRYEQIRLPADNPSKELSIRDEHNGRKLSFSPAYRGGSVKYFGASLHLSPQSDEDTLQAIDRYLSDPPVSGLPRLNLTWMTSIDISRYGEHVDPENFSFANAPCIVAPALQGLHLSRYVVDWRCHNLKRLTISMDRMETGEPSANYRYPPTQLFARIHDSRLTLERLRLSGCLPTVPEDDRRKGRAPAASFPRLHDLDVAETPHEAAWFCAQIGFPVSSPPLVYGNHRSAISSLRSLACEYAHSVPNPKPALPGFHGELDALTFRNGNEYEDGCIITAFSIEGIVRPWLRHEPTFSLDFYAQNCAARYTDCDTDQDVRQLDGRVPGMDPKFVTKLGWDLDDWNVPASTTDDACSAHCSALHGIKHVFIEGFDSRLFRQDPDAQVWTAVLRHLPNVRSLYIYAPCPASLAPLINEPDLLPALKYLWLGCDDESKGDDDLESNFRYGSDTDYNSESDYEPEPDSEEGNATLEEGDANLEEGDVDLEEGDVDLEEGDVSLEEYYALLKSTYTDKDRGGTSVGIDDLLMGSGDAKGSHPTSIPDKGALDSDSESYTGPKAKARKIDAGLLSSILKSRDLELRLVNLVVDGDPQSMQEFDQF